MLVTLIVIIVVVFAGVVAAIHWKNQDSVTSPDQTASQQALSSPTPTDTTSSTPAPTQVAAASPTPSAGSCVRNFSQAQLSKNANMNISSRQVTINVQNFGPITLELYDKDAPKAVENFLRLTDAGYYNCLTFHRVIAGFMIQGGDPTGTGSGGQSAYGAPFADELDPNTLSAKAGYVKGVLAMANSGPNTNGSQFFIMLADNQLPHLYTIFGKVIAGQDTVDKIGQVPVQHSADPNAAPPVTPVVMESIKVAK